MKVGHRRNRMDEFWQMMNQPSTPTEKPPLRKRRILSIILIILLDCLLVLALIFFFPSFMGSTDRREISSDWTGFIVASNLDNPQPTVTAIEASWTVPSVAMTSRNSFSATWIGVGGQFDNTLIQTGTEQDSIDGTGQYMAWYELLPELQVPIPSISVSPGDRITASITLSNSTPNTWQIRVIDSASDADIQSFTENFVYNSSKLSAEWIVERPNVNNVLRPLANFHEETFTGCRATIAGKAEAINKFPYIQAAIYSQNTQITSVSSFTSNGSSFTVNYKG